MYRLPEALIDRYTEDNFYEIQRLNPLVSEYTLGMTGKALDLGAGKGTNSKYLTDNGFEVTAVDINPRAIEMMRRQGVDPQWQDIVELRWSREDYYDVIICLYVFQHLSDDDIAKVVRHMKYSLKKGGTMILGSFKTPNNDLSLESMAHLFCGDDGFEMLVKDSWKRIDVSHGTPHYHEGFNLVVKKVGN